MGPWHRLEPTRFLFPPLFDEGEYDGDAKSEMVRIGNFAIFFLFFEKICAQYLKLTPGTFETHISPKFKNYIYFFIILPAVS